MMLRSQETETIQMTQYEVEKHKESPSETMGGEKRWIALYVLCVGMLMIVLDATVVNVALPAIQNDLGFSQSSLAWVVNAYLIAFGGLLLLAGRLGDLISRRGIFWPALGCSRWPHCCVASRRARSCWSWPASFRELAAP
jgi:MFS family permease